MWLESLKYFATRVQKTLLKARTHLNHRFFMRQYLPDRGKLQRPPAIELPTYLLCLFLNIIEDGRGADCNYVWL